MPDTTPQRLKHIRDQRDHYAHRGGRYDADWFDAINDLLAMIDALEAQIWDLTKPEEDVPAPNIHTHLAHEVLAFGRDRPTDLNCLRCHGRGNILGSAGYLHCPQCDPGGKIPLPTLSAQ